MQVAILHYHLNRGGVTRVIQNHLLALDAVLPRQATLAVALIHGGRRMAWPEDLPERLRSIRLTLHALPALDYDDQQADGPPQPGALGAQLMRVLDDLDFAPQETVLHIHNHAVGKNAALPECAWSLAERGYGMLLHIHDFVEDFRPSNFRKLAHAMGQGASTPSWHGRLYPQAPHIHYAVLTSRDRQVLEGAGTDVDRLHLLPNPVPKVENLPPREQARRRLAEQFAVALDDRFVLYPVRGIRRKNVGEALLYSRLAPPGSVVGLTLPPISPAAKPTYARWRQVAAELALPCRFDVGAEDGLGFGENLAASDLILTTSVAEGFGMAFLESWLAGRALVGRDLPETTADFKMAGVCLDRLRPQLHVPSSWVDLHYLRQTLLGAYRLALAAYDRPQPVDLSHGLNAKTGGALIDFADLDEPLQEQVIQRVSGSDQDLGQLRECNAWIGQAFSAGPHEVAELIHNNARTIARHYSLGPSGQRLRELYEQVVASPRGGVSEPLEHADRIFGCFLDLGRFRLIRSDDTPQALDGGAEFPQ